MSAITMKTNARGYERPFLLSEFEAADTLTLPAGHPGVIEILNDEGLSLYISFTNSTKTPAAHLFAEPSDSADVKDERVDLRLVPEIEYTIAKGAV